MSELLEDRSSSPLPDGVEGVGGMVFVRVCTILADSGCFVGYLMELSVLVCLPSRMCLISFEPRIMSYISVWLGGGGYERARFEKVGCCMRVGDERVISTPESCRTSRSAGT